MNLYYILVFAFGVWIGYRIPLAKQKAIGGFEYLVSYLKNEKQSTHKP